MSVEGAAAVLRWFRSAGVDVSLQEEPRDRFAETQSEAEQRRARKPDASVPSAPASTPSPSSVRSSPPVRPPPPAAAAAIAPLSHDAAVAEASMLASRAPTLEALRAALDGFEGCRLKDTATNFVFGAGEARSGLMIVGDPPDRAEDISGHPFSGRPGQLLDRMLAAIGLDRESVRLANAVPWRPPGNRAPTQLELDTCRPFLVRQIELAAPLVVLAAGSCAVKILTGSDEGILRARGHWTTLDIGSGRTVAVVATLHPEYLLKQPAQKKHAWRDLLSVRQRLADESARTDRD